MLNDQVRQTEKLRRKRSIDNERLGGTTVVKHRKPDSLQRARFNAKPVELQRTLVGIPAIKPQPKPSVKPEQPKPEIKPQPKASDAKPEAKPEIKPQPKPSVKPEQPKPEIKPQPKASNAKPEAKPEIKPSVKPEQSRAQEPKTTVKPENQNNPIVKTSEIKPVAKPKEFVPPPPPPPPPAPSTKIVTVVKTAENKPERTSIVNPSRPSGANVINTISTKQVQDPRLVKPPEIVNKTERVSFPKRPPIAEALTAADDTYEAFIERLKNSGEVVSVSKPKASVIVDDDKQLLSSLIDIQKADYIENQTKHFTGLFKATFHNRFGKFVFILNKERVDSIQLSKGLAYMLGYETQEISSSLHATTNIDFHNGLHAFFVYSNICDLSILGNSRSNLLRIMKVQGEHGDIVSQDFNPIQYIPVLNKNVQTIEIMICDSVGAPINFQYGDVIVVLHFRRKTSS
uniref:PAS domain-containing protein n=1 Tax=Steinernema glaseri TaxID=37863 RepID=A0A1I8AQF7_9BILA